MSTQNLIYIFISSFAALFPVVNPIGSGFIINSFIKDLDDDQRKLAIKKIIINCLLIAIGSLAIGHFVLLLFGLAIPVIQVGGGIIICKTGMEWLSNPSSSDTDDKQKTIDKINMDEIERKLFYPISFPMIIGAGSISVIFTLMANVTVKENPFYTVINYSVIAFVIFTMLAILYIFLLQGRKIMKKLGKSGNLIINKLIAFITFCIGIQIIVTGVSKIFHIPVL